MSAATSYRPAGQRETLDFSGANFLSLLFGIVIVIAFIFMPWTGTEIPYNGARAMADLIAGTPGANVTLSIALIPITAIAAVCLALWGVLAPDRARLASLLTSVAGLVGLIHFAATFISPGNFPLGSAGLGFWVSLLCLLGLVFQVAVTHPALTARWQATTGGLSARLPHISPKPVPYLILLVPLLLYLAWIIFPTLYTFYLSLTDWDGVSAPRYIGLANFERLFTRDRTFTEALINNARWLAVFITVPTSLGLGLAMVFNTEMKGGRFYKVSFYSPLVISLPVIGLIWAWVYNPHMGLINSLLRAFGLADPPGWLADRELAIWCIIGAAVWRQVGYVMVLYLAGLKNIDPTLVDAALVDGANRWNLFRRVIFPLLAPVTTIIIVISIIASLRAFDLVQIMTRGGQGTEVLANFMYIEAFNNYKMGYGAAIAVILFAISLVFIGFYLSRVIKDELEY